jgi:hypothetical protein
MRHMRGAFIVTIAIAIACSGKKEDAPPAVDVTKFDDCADDNVPLRGGGCKPIGVRECSKGMTADGQGGCTATTPACAFGSFAGLGEPACHEVMECGEAPYGDAPSGAVFVNGAFTGVGDGTRDKPFTTIAAAIAKSPAAIAIADGVYSESIVLTTPVTLHGRCPAKVEIKGTGTRAIAARAKVEIRGVAVTGAGQGIAVDGVDVKMDQVWIHDTAGSAVVVLSPSTGAVLSRSLIEKVKNTGAYVEGAALRMESSVIRAVATGSDGRGGNGVQAQIARDGKPSTVTVVGSIIENAVASAALTYGSDLTIDGSLLRDIPGRTDVSSCVQAQKGSAAPRAPEVKIIGSILERCAGSGVRIDDGSLTVERSSVRDTKVNSAMALGIAIDGTSSTLTLHDSFFGGVARRGIYAGGSSGSIERSIVRDVAGIGIAIARATTVEPTMTITDCAVLHTNTIGIYSGGSKVDILRTLVRDVKREPETELYGDAIEASAVYDPIPNDLRGSHVTVTDTVVRDAARSGFLLFASVGAVEKSSLGCSGLDLAVGRTYRKEGGVLGQADFDLDDRGGNFCGCPARTTCHAETTAIEPVSFAR